MGTGYKGGTNYQYSVLDNIQIVSSIYDYVDGYFGKPANSKNNFVRIIRSNSPALTGKDFYDKIAYGAKQEHLKNGKGKIAFMQDGTVITFRPITKSDQNPGVEINITKSNNCGNLKSQKLHFEYKENN